MKYVIDYAFDKESGVTTCEICNKTTGDLWVGAAICHSDDNDMMSEKTGKEIAFRRAEIAALQWQKQQLKVELKSLKQLYYSMDRSKKFNPKSYEARMLRRQISQREDDIAGFTEIIEIKKLDLKDFIDSKDEFYQTVRKNRQS